MNSYADLLKGLVGKEGRLYPSEGGYEFLIGATSGDILRIVDVGTDYVEFSGTRYIPLSNGFSGCTYIPLNLLVVNIMK